MFLFLDRRIAFAFDTIEWGEAYIKGFAWDNSHQIKIGYYLGGALGEISVSSLYENSTV